MGNFFCFISSSCSFAALATTKSLFKKGAGFVPSLTFLLASTNLVIELGFTIAVFLSWQFVVDEYVGRILLIRFIWLIVRFTRPKKLIEKTRQRLNERQGQDNGQQNAPDWKDKITSLQRRRQVARKYFLMENSVERCHLRFYRRWHYCCFCPAVTFPNPVYRHRLRQSELFSFTRKYLNWLGCSVFYTIDRK